MKYKKVVPFVLSTFLLVSCGEQEMKISEEDYNAVIRRNAELEEELNKSNNDAGSDGDISTMQIDYSYDESCAELDEEYDDYLSSRNVSYSIPDNSVQIMDEYEFYDGGTTYRCIALKKHIR